MGIWYGVMFVNVVVFNEIKTIEIVGPTRSGTLVSFS